MDDQTTNRTESQGLFFETKEEVYELEQLKQHFDVYQMAKTSFEILEQTYKVDFPYSEEYKELVIRLHDNVIEYSFLSQAGLIRP